MKKTTAGLLAAVAALTFAGAAEAQTLPLSFEVRGGFAIPTGDFEEGLETGVTVGANATFNITPMLGIYAGYSWTQFGVEDLDDVDVTDSGLDAGVKASFGLPGFPVMPFLKGGLVYHSLEISDGEDEESSDTELGFEVGGGFTLPLGPRISFTPAVTYTQYGLGDEDIDLDIDVSYIKLDIGLNIRI